MDIGIIGAGGYWAKNIIRNLEKHPRIEKIFLIESDFYKAQELSYKYRKLSHTICNNYLDDSLIKNCNAFIISTPIHTHFEIAKALLELDKPVLVQKPLAMSIEECETLNHIAQIRQTVLMVAHTYIYNESIKYIKQILPELGKIRYFKSTRINLGLFNRNSDVIYDLAPHDFSIIRYLFRNTAPLTVSATGQVNVANLIDTANITVQWESGPFCNIDVSWISALKRRDILIIGSEKTIHYNDCDPNNPIAIIHSSVDYDANQLFNYKKGKIEYPQIHNSEAIYNEINDFIRAIDEKERPISDGIMGEDVVRMICAAERSLQTDGDFA